MIAQLTAPRVTSLIAAALMLGGLHSSTPQRNDTLPDDEFQRTATLALAGAYGPLKDWQYDLYAHGLKHGVRCRGYAYVTSYGMWEHPISDGTWAAQDLPDGRGRRLDDSMCSADTGLPFGTVIYVDGTLRVVRDRGGAVTVANARIRGHRRNTRNIDLWTQTRDEHFRASAPYAIVGRVQ